MKKITYLFMLAGAIAFAQQSDSYLDATPQEPSGNTNGLAIITGNSDGVIDTYDNLTDFTDNVDIFCADPTLTSEDFTGGPGGITTCGPTVSSAGDGCFAAGEIEDGFVAEASNGTDMVNIPPGAIGNADSLIGASAFAEYTIINFDPNVFAVAMDIWENNDPTTEVRIFDAGGTLIETLQVTTPINEQTFFGFIADEPISKVELEGANGSGELYGNFLFGADCLVFGVDDNLLSQVSLFPNPATDIVNIQLPNTVEMKSIAVYDVLGKVVVNSATNNQINVSQLNGGVYMVTIETNQGTVTKKIIKK
jgi:hypothetical protein